MAPFNVRSKVQIAPFQVRSKFAVFSPHMEGSNADFAQHIEDFTSHSTPPPSTPDITKGELLFSSVGPLTLIYVH